MKVEFPENIEMPIHDNGILIRFARCVMWCVRIGDDLVSSSIISRLKKHLANPDARLGVWIEVSYIVSTRINMTKDKMVKAYVDLQDGSFIITGRSTTNSVGDIHKLSQIPQESHYSHEDKIIKKVIEYMISKWRTKMTREI